MGESKKLFLPPLLLSAKIELSFLRERWTFTSTSEKGGETNAATGGDAEKGKIFLIVVLELTCQSIHMFSN